MQPKTCPLLAENPLSVAIIGERKIEMGSKEGSRAWSVFDGVKSIPSSPEALMAEINTAISTLEFACATALLQSPPFPKGKNANSNSSSQYDARVADEAYKAGLAVAALAAAKLDEAFHSLNIALSKCPPNKTNAVAKLQSLISLTSQQLQKSSN